MRLFLLLLSLTAMLAIPALAAPLPTPAPSPSASTLPAAPARTFYGLPTGDRTIAAGLSLAVTGLGQHYLGRPNDGNVMMASLLTFPLAYGLDALADSSYMRLFSYTLVLAVKTWSVWDAYQPPAPAPTPSPAAH